VIKVKVGRLLKERGKNATDLMREARIAYTTALRLSKGEGNGMSFEVLDRLCAYFNVQVKDIIEYVPD
jgi:DNA-binding Xre family transcriptional regulator